MKTIEQLFPSTPIGDHNAYMSAFHLTPFQITTDYQNLFFSKLNPLKFYIVFHLYREMLRFD